DAHINVVYHISSVEPTDTTRIDFAAWTTNPPAALDMMLSGHDLRSIQIGRRTIMVLGKDYGQSENTRVGALVSKSEANQNTEPRQPAVHPRTMVFIFKPMNLYYAILMVRQSAHLNIVLDPAVELSARATTFSVELRDVTIGQALEFILKAYDWTFAQIDA